MVPLKKVYRRGAPYPVWVEVYPERCPGCGEPYRGGHVAIGYLSCGCDGAKTNRAAHRTLYCRDCATEVFLPPHMQRHGPWLPGTEPARESWYPPSPTPQR